MQIPHMIASIVKVVGEGNTYEILESLRGLGSTENLMCLM